MPADCIVITGTPGTGKTTVSNQLSELGYLVINLFDFAVKHDCVEDTDEIRDALIVDEDKLSEIIGNYLEAGYGTIIIDSHYGDIVPDKYVRRAFVLSAPINLLKDRLSRRAYSVEKVNENVEAELFQVCWTDALDAFGTQKVVKIENTDLEETINIIKSYIDNTIEKR